MFNNFFLKIRTVYEIMWKNTVPAGQATDDSITRRMPVACSITKVYDTNSKYVIHIAYVLQQSFRERA